MVNPSDITSAHERWKAAVAAGEASAFAATSEALRGCSTALHHLAQELTKLRYPVANPFLPCDEDFEALWRFVEGKVDHDVPTALVRFWTIVGGVSLVDLVSYSHTRFWQRHKVKAQFCDGLRVEPCNQDWVDYTVTDYAQRREDGFDFDAEPFYFDLSPDGYHKDDISGGASYGLAPRPSWLPTWTHFTWPGPQRPLSAPTDPPDFLGYLRTAILECAGFPGLLGDPAFEPIRRQLLANVQVF